jgi:hypothetical protein
MALAGQEMANKRLEWWYIEQLRRAISDFPSGTILGDESPDFVVQSDERAVGIEVTTFHWPASEGKRPHQEQQVLKERVVAIAEKIHQPEGDRPWRQGLRGDSSA